MSKEQEITPQESGIIEATLLHHQEDILGGIQGIMLLSQIINKTCKEFGKHTIQEVQRSLDKLGMDVVLFAVPVESDFLDGGKVTLFHSISNFVFDRRKFEAKMPHARGETYPNWLYTVIQKPEEVSMLYEIFETNGEDNFDRLLQTGMPVPKPGTDEAKVMTAHLN